MAAQVEALTRYNSAIHGRTAALNGGGSDFGGPVRKAAAEVCVCVYLLIAHNRAIRPCQPCHSMPLALIFPMGD